MLWNPVDSQEKQYRIWKTAKDKLSFWWRKKTLFKKNFLKNFWWQGLNKTFGCVHSIYSFFFFSYFRWKLGGKSLHHIFSLWYIHWFHNRHVLKHVRKLIKGLSTVNKRNEWHGNIVSTNIRLLLGWINK